MSREPKRRAEPGSPAPWQAGGEERCDFCHTFYIYEMEVRCLACDRAVCPCCVRVTRTEGVFCPDCAR